MDTVKLLLITVLPALVLGCIVGVATGKHNIKKANNQLRPVLSLRQRIIYSASIAVGIACILTGIFYNPAAEMGGMEDGMWMEDDMGMGDYDPGMDMIDPMPGDPGVAEPLPGGDIALFDTEDPVDGEVTDELGEEVALEEEVDDTGVAEPAPMPTPRSSGGTAVAEPAPRPGGTVIIGGSGGSVRVG